MISEQLRQFRKEHRLTQQSIADALKIDRTTYTFYETGTTQPSVKTICKLAKIYNTSVGHLLGVEEDMPEIRKEAIFTSSQLHQSNRTDSIAYLEKNEQALLLHFRLLKDDNKIDVLKFMKDLILQAEAEEDSELSE